MSTIKVLTVDDSPSIRNIIKSFLQSEGYDVHEAKDGLEALEVVKTTQFNIMIVDVNMPRMDGISFVREVRKLPQYRNIPIIILTTESQEKKKMEGKKAGANGWIVKPFGAQEFGKIIKKLTA